MLPSAIRKKKGRDDQSAFWDALIYKKQINQSLHNRYTLVTRNHYRFDIHKLANTITAVLSTITAVFYTTEG